jgi:hypothetical protein
MLYFMVLITRGSHLEALIRGRAVVGESSNVFGTVN